VIVNCTPLGMSRRDCLPVDVDKIERGSLVVELVPRPAETLRLRRAAARDCAVQPGLATLEAQVGLVLDFLRRPLVSPAGHGAGSSEGG
jgi:shikimate dehydrogenase